MPLEDLREQGVLLPEEEWGEHSLETTVHRWWLLAVFAVAVASLVATFVGDGGWPTWVGIAVFLLALFGATVLCDRAIERLRERIEAERRS